jgi:hypothetical protein
VPEGLAAGPGDVAVAPRAPEARAPQSQAPGASAAASTAAQAPSPVQAMTHEPPAFRPGTGLAGLRGGVPGGGGSTGETSDVGVEIPTIHFAPWASRDEMIAITAYFGMQLIAYPPEHDYFVVVQLATSRFELSKEFRYLKLFSNRMIAQDGPLFEELRRKIGRDVGAAAERLTTGLIMPLKTANYLAWKEVAVCRKLGFEAAAVESVSGRFVRTDEGKWNLYIDELQLKNGRRIPCGDMDNRVAN